MSGCSGGARIRRAGKMASRCSSDVQMDRLREQIRWERMKAADEAADREGRPQGHHWNFLLTEIVSISVSIATFWGHKFFLCIHICIHLQIYVSIVGGRVIHKKNVRIHNCIHAVSIQKTCKMDTSNGYTFWIHSWIHSIIHGYTISSLDTYYVPVIVRWIHYFQVDTKFVPDFWEWIHILSLGYRFMSK